MQEYPTIEDANKYLKDIYIPKFNKRFWLSSNTIASIFDSIPTKDKINETLAILKIRKIDNGNSIKYNGKYYQLYNNGQIACFKPKTECLVVKCFDGTLVATVNETVYELKELLIHKKISKEIDFKDEIKPKK